MGIFASGLEYRAASSLANPEKWLVDWFSRGSDTYTGKKINEYTAYDVSTFSAAVRIISESVASLPLFLYRQDGNKRSKFTSSSLYNVLHRQPNPEMDSFIWRECATGHLCTWGYHFSEIVRNGMGDVAELWPLRPDKMTMHRIEGELYYKYDLDGTPKWFRADQILHLRWFTFDGLSAYNPVGQVRQALGLSSAAEEFGGNFYKNGASPGAVLEHPGELDEESHDNLKQWIDSQTMGLDRAHRLMILEEGMKWHDIGIAPELAQFLETRKFQVEEIARFYRIPLHMLSSTEKSTSWGTGIESMNIGFVVHTLRPWLIRWEMEILRSLVKPNQKNNVYAEFLIDGMLRGDTKTRFEAYSIGVQNGLLSQDEIRQKENMNPLPDGKGDKYWFPMNFQEIGAPVKESSARSVFRPLVRDAVTRMMRREKADVLRKYEKTPDLDKFRSFVNDFFRAHESYCRDQLETVYRSYCDSIGDMPTSECLNNIINRHCRDSAAMVLAAMQNGGIEKEIQRWFDERINKEVDIILETIGGDNDAT